MNEYADEILLSPDHKNQSPAGALDQQEREAGVEPDSTPVKNDDYLLNLLSNLEGLTPAGLEHLMETQDKIATKVTPVPLQQREETDKNLADDLDLLSKKTSEVV